MKAPSIRMPNSTWAPRGRQKLSAYPLSAPISTGRMVLGTTMATEFQNPALMPSQDTPVQTSLQAARQGSSVAFMGSAKSWPRRISSMVLKEVTSMM